VFVRPQAAGNIGALCRAMSNFAAHDLRLVGPGAAVYGANPDDPFSRMDWAMAKRGENVLQKARWFATMEEALADCHLVIGTSGRNVEFERGYARPICLPEAAFSAADDWEKQTGADFTWALVLGPEDDGLSDHEAALCQKLIRISTVDKSPSINVSMCAGMLLYHWHLFNLQEQGKRVEAANLDGGAFLDVETSKRLPFREPGRGTWARFEHKEAFLNYVMETVSQTQFLKYPDSAAVRARVRRWLQAAPIPLGELLFAFEIVYNLRAWGTGHFEKRDFLRTVPAGELQP